MHLVGPCEVLVGGGNYRAVGVFQPIQPCLKPLHRDTAQIDDIAAHRTLVRGDQGGHKIGVLKDHFRRCDDLVPQGFVDLGAAAHAGLGLVFSGSIADPYRIFCPVFAQSAKKVSRPLSVSGCIASFLITSGGAVITSAPMRALSRTWFTVRMDAARICVSNP